MKDVFSPKFSKYGRVITEYDFAPLIAALEKLPIPDGIYYEPSTAVFEELPLFEQLKAGFSAGMPIEIGYCNGHNKAVSGFEYHKCSEINFCSTDFVLAVGLRTDIESDWTYDLANVEAFLCPAGCTVELYATTLHYAPIQTADSGFRTGVVLAEGTNTPFEPADRNGENRLIFAKNKWLLVCDGDAAVDQGAWPGIKGVLPAGCLD